MIANPLLEELEHLQKQLAQEAQYDLTKHVANSHQIVRAVEQQYGIKFQYHTLAGGEVSWLEGR